RTASCTIIQADCLMSCYTGKLPHVLSFKWTTWCSTIQAKSLVSCYTDGLPRVLLYRRNAS
ncbi:hypothetical protein HAX54_052913, partial [Datura stramonium]|nr:hypothetical protein [Datura stramonium]